MPIRFSTEAANADHIRTESEPGLPGDVDADGTPRDRRDRTPQREPRGGAARDEQAGSVPAKPGKDINAPGFVKDRDTGQP